MLTSIMYYLSSPKALSTLLGLATIKAQSTSSLT